MMRKTPDEELMESAAAGDSAAVEELFVRHHRDLYRFFRRAGGGSDSPDDLVQEVFLRVLKYARGFRTGGSFRAWLYRIARNAVADSSRREASRGPVGPVAVENVASESPSLEMLEDALERIPAADREVIVLARFVGLSGDELAAALECSSAAARVRLHRALTRLRASCVEKREGRGNAM